MSPIKFDVGPFTHCENVKVDICPIARRVAVSSCGIDSTVRIDVNGSLSTDGACESPPTGPCELSWVMPLGRPSGVDTANELRATTVVIDPIVCFGSALLRFA